MAEILPDLHCACANLRRAARLVTQLYTGEMGLNMEPTQFALLSGLRGRELSQTQLARALGLDKTTLSRNLRLLVRNGWIELANSQDGRERICRLTRTGEKVHAATQPAWRRAQAKLQSALKSGEWEALMKISNRVAEAALTANSSAP